jgi:hypothetical protein
MKLKKDGTPRKAGSGRTKGATSLVSIRLSELNDRFKQEDLIVVGRIFARQAGLGEDIKAISEPTPSSGITLHV